MKGVEFLKTLLKEPPFRLLSRIAVKYLPFSLRTKADWDVVDRPHYLVGMLRAADQAKSLGVDEIGVVEFGVASGAGLLEMQKYADMVEKETGIRILVYGFDSGRGLPDFSGDYREHPEIWAPGDYPMDEARLRRELTARTQLILGNVKNTVPEFVRSLQKCPIGFVAIDVDWFTSTRDALKILSDPGKSILRRVILYLDDTETLLYHRFAGEYLAFEDFNQHSELVKIDRWRGLQYHRPFPDQRWIMRMWVAYDLDAMTKLEFVGREVQVL